MAIRGGRGVSKGAVPTLCCCCSCCCMGMFIGGAVVVQASGVVSREAGMVAQQHLQAPHAVHEHPADKLDSSNAEGEGSGRATPAEPAAAVCVPPHAHRPPACCPTRWQGPLYINPLMSFIDERCLIFTPDEENKLEYTVVGKRTHTLAHKPGSHEGFLRLRTAHDALPQQCKQHSSARASDCPAATSPPHAACCSCLQLLSFCPACGTRFPYRPPLPQYHMEFKALVEGLLEDFLADLGISHEELYAVGLGWHHVSSCALHTHTRPCPTHATACMPNGPPCCIIWLRARRAPRCK